MGMDFQYAGSASYPRFEQELCEIAKVFNGIETEHLKQRKETESKKPFGHWFGFLGADNAEESKFIFPEETNEILIKWFNDVYSENFTSDETKIIWENISKHPEIKEISRQIWEELEILCEENEPWRVY